MKRCVLKEGMQYYLYSQYFLNFINGYRNHVGEPVKMQFLIHSLE